MAHVKKKQNKYGHVLQVGGEHCLKLKEYHPYSTFRENSLKVIELSSISRDALITSLERENSLKQLEPH